MLGGRHLPFIALTGVMVVLSLASGCQRLVRTRRAEPSADLASMAGTYRGGVHHSRSSVMHRLHLGRSGDFTLHTTAHLPEGVFTGEAQGGVWRACSDRLLRLQFRGQPAFHVVASGDTLFIPRSELDSSQDPGLSPLEFRREETE